MITHGIKYWNDRGTFVIRPRFDISNSGYEHHLALQGFRTANLCVILGKNKTIKYAKNLPDLINYAYCFRLQTK